MTYSAVIPVYNAQRYLPACLDSVLAQDTPSEYEAVLVDDGSTDRSGAICDEYAARDGRVRVIHQENGGPGAARNRGLREAKGRYVLFLDADDLWSSGFLSALDGLSKKEPDIMTFSACQFLDRPGDGSEIRQPLLPSGESGGAWLDKLFHVQELPQPYTWIYGYRREFLEGNGSLFRTDLWTAEDFDFIMRCLPQAGRVLGTDRVLYHYRTAEGSLIHTQTPGKIMNGLEVGEWVFRKWPNAAAANHYCSVAVMLAVLGEREKEQEAAAFIRKNWDIWRCATYRPYRLGYVLFRALGCHYGSAVYQALESFWHKHGKTGALAGER